MQEFRWIVTNIPEYLEKNSLNVVLLVVYPNLEKPFMIYIDSSQNCIGAVLVNKAKLSDGMIPRITMEVLIHFLSHKLTKS